MQLNQNFYIIFLWKIIENVTVRTTYMIHKMHLNRVSSCYCKIITNITFRTPFSILRYFSVFFFLILLPLRRSDGKKNKYKSAKNN